MADRNTRKTVLITGAGIGGIGGELAREFHRKGYRVFATARRPETIAVLKEEGIETLSLDVTKADSIAACVKEVEGLTGGKLDILWNNAGINYTVPAIELDIDEVRNLFETNVFGVMAVTQAFVPFLIATKGKIVMTGSLSGVMPHMFSSAYNASKGALHCYTNTLRVELSPFDVQVINIITGGVKSQLGRTDRDLEPNSLYLPIEDSYKERQTHSNAIGMPADKFARSVVGHVLQRHPSPWYWEGYFAWTAWFLERFFPRWIFDWPLKHRFGILKLAKIYKEQKKAQ